MRGNKDEGVVAISAWLVDVFKDNITPDKVTEALVGALIIVHRTSRHRRNRGDHSAADYPDR
jgi:hypothetical protein